MNKFFLSNFGNAEYADDAELRGFDILDLKTNQISEYPLNLHHLRAQYHTIKY